MNEHYATDTEAPARSHQLKQLPDYSGLQARWSVLPGTVAFVPPARQRPTVRYCTSRCDDAALAPWRFRTASARARGPRALKMIAGVHAGSPGELLVRYACPYRQEEERESWRG